MVIFHSFLMCFSMEVSEVIGSSPQVIQHFLVMINGEKQGWFWETTTWEVRYSSIFQGNPWLNQTCLVIQRIFFQSRIFRRNQQLKFQTYSQNSHIFPYIPWIHVPSNGCPIGNPAASAVEPKAPEISAAEQSIAWKPSTANGRFKHPQNTQIPIPNIRSKCIFERKT